MARVTIKEWYKRVNAAWPAEVPELTAEEHVRIARRLYRYVMGKTWTGAVKVTSGNRYAWVHGGALIVNPTQPIDGRRGDVHLLSHYFHQQINPGVKPHSAAHARLELRMVKALVARGYLNGKAAPKSKPEKSKHEKNVARLTATLLRWEKRVAKANATLRRSAKAMRKLKAKLKKLNAAPTA